MEETTRRELIEMFGLHAKRYTTIQIFYHVPDHPSIIQEFLYQDLDKVPEFPRMNRLLDHWHTHIEATIQSVQLAVQGYGRLPDYRAPGAVFTL